MRHNARMELKCLGLVQMMDEWRFLLFLLSRNSNALLPSWKSCSRSALTSAIITSNSRYTPVCGEAFASPLWIVPPILDTFSQPTSKPTIPSTRTQAPCPPEADVPRCMLTHVNLSSGVVHCRMCSSIPIGVTKENTWHLLKKSCGNWKETGLVPLWKRLFRFLSLKSIGLYSPTRMPARSVKNSQKSNIPKSLSVFIPTVNAKFQKNMLGTIMLLECANWIACRASACISAQR